MCIPRGAYSHPGTRRCRRDRASDRSLPTGYSEVVIRNAFNADGPLEDCCRAKVKGTQLRKSKTEVKIGVRVLNRMTGLGRPLSNAQPEIRLG